MNGNGQCCQNLGEFLKACRRQLARAEVGLPAECGKRTPGLRREEVCSLSGVSVTWYTWLEQGRNVKPFRQVLDALARSLRLSTFEHTYMLSLAGYSAPEPAAEVNVQMIPPHARRLLDALTGCPACLIVPDWAILGWNTAFPVLYPSVSTVPVWDRNLLWLVFTDPLIRERMRDWETASRYLAATSRADAGPLLHTPSVSRLVGRLLEASEPFCTSWENHDIQTFSSQERVFCHPVAGDLHLQTHCLKFSAYPGLCLMVYTPVPTTDTATRLRQLADQGLAFRHKDCSSIHEAVPVGERTPP